MVACRLLPLHWRTALCLVVLALALLGPIFGIAILPSAASPQGSLAQASPSELLPQAPAPQPPPGTAEVSHVRVVTDAQGDVHILGLVSYTEPPWVMALEVAAVLYDANGAILRLGSTRVMPIRPRPTDLSYSFPFSITLRSPPSYASYRIWVTPANLQPPPAPPPPPKEPPMLPTPVASPTPFPPATPTPTGAVDVREGLRSIEPYLVLVITYDPSDGADPWKLFDAEPGAIGYFDLKLLERGKAYWLYVRQDCVLTYGPSTRRLTKGWNLISWPPQPSTGVILSHA